MSLHGCYRDDLFQRVAKRMNGCTPFRNYSGLSPFRLTTLVFICLSSFAPQLFGKAYTVTGDIEWSVIQLNGQVSVTNKYSFAVETSDNSYRLTVVSIEGEYYNDQIAAGDGLDCYYLKRTWPSWQAKRSGTGMEEYGFVTPGEFPVESDRPIQCLWLMFCAKDYFSNSSNQMNLEFSDINYVDNKTITNVIKWMTNQPRFVQSVQAYVPHVQIGGKVANLPDVFEGRFRVWEINQTGTTNFQYESFPSRFEYRQFFPKFQGATSEYKDHVIRHAVFRVKNVSRSVKSPDLLPETKGRVMVTDFRFENDLPTQDGKNIGFIYYSTDNNWRSRTNREVRIQLAEITNAVIPSAPISGVANPFVSKAIIGVTVFTTICLVWWVKKQKINK